MTVIPHLDHGVGTFEPVRAHGEDTALSFPQMQTYSKNMAKTKSETDVYMCPMCKQPVPTAIHRRRTLGVFVPVWGPGACQNRDCPEYRLDPQHKKSPAR